MISRCRSAARRPTAFTLLELLLVLAVMVVVGAFALPGIFGVLANRQLARGGNGLRVAMVQARLEAMRTGRTQIMRFEIGGSRYEVAPHYSASDVTEAGDRIGSGTAVASGGVAIPTLPGGASGPANAPGSAPDDGGPSDMLSVASDDQRLPESVLFSDAQIQATARSSTITNEPSSTGFAAATTAGAGWSQPILFYADGSTSTAVVTLSREEVGRIVVRLRGLTGETTVSEILP